MNISVLIAALIAVESGGDSKAVGDNGQAVGCLQIHPIFVEDVNRIVGGEHFHLTDREDRMKSIEMVTIWLAYYKGRYTERCFEPEYMEMALMFNRGYSGFCKMRRVAMFDDPYWLKVEAALDELGDW